MNKLLTILGAIALTFTLSMAGEGKCGGDKSKTEMKCADGKCGGDMNKSKKKCADGKCGGDMKKKVPVAPEKGKCGS